MAKKKTTAVEKSPTADRHKPRKAIHLPPEMHEALSRYADQEGIPLRWQAIRILAKALKEAGFGPS